MTTGAQLQGATIGSYVVRHEIGNGGMGSVFLVEHKMLGRRAALKMLHPEMSANQEMVQRFFNEARAASAIKSPGIVEIYDFGYHVDNRAYIVMELLEGEPLSMRLRRLRALPVLQALTIARQIASALGPAHRAGIVHRDLKPDNVYLVPDGEAASGERTKILDFGIAKLSGGDGLGSGMQATSTKMVMGSPHYMSPEQCRGAGVVDARSDLYALGCILFECLTGRPPFVGEGFGELMGAHLHVPPPPLGGFVPGMPPEVDALVQRLLAKAVAQRPQSAEEAAAALNELIGQLRSMSAVAQLQPSAATLHMSPGSYPPGTPGPARMPTPGPMQLPQQAGSGMYPGQSSSGSYPGGAAGSYAGAPAPGSPTTMRHSSGSSTTPPQARSSGRSMLLIGGTAAVLSIAVVVIVLMSSKGGGRAAPVVAVAPVVDAAVAPPPATADTPPAKPTTADVPPVPPKTVDTPPTPPPSEPPPTSTTSTTEPPSTTEPATAPSEKDREKDKERKRKKAEAAEAEAKAAAAAAAAAAEKAKPAVLPEELSKQAQDAGYDPVRSKIKKCAADKGVKGTVFVTVTVRPDGKVGSAQITSSTNPELAGCVSSLLASARFEATQKGGKFRPIIIIE